MFGCPCFLAVKYQHNEQLDPLESRGFWLGCWVLGEKEFGNLKPKKCWWMKYSQKIWHNTLPKYMSTISNSDYKYAYIHYIQIQSRGGSGISYIFLEIEISLCEFCPSSWSFSPSRRECVQMGRALELMKKGVCTPPGWGSVRISAKRTWKSRDFRWRCLYTMILPRYVDGFTYRFPWYVVYFRNFSCVFATNLLQFQWGTLWQTIGVFPSVPFSPSRGKKCRVKHWPLIYSYGTSDFF